MIYKHPLKIIELRGMNKKNNDYLGTATINESTEPRCRTLQRGSDKRRTRVSPSPPSRVK
jgi:hypothetical protein